ncbi:MAG: hypothetical protein GY805_12375 [Chloroflexi bacterium]|nr:hypothetical protein [Chloroflexota bacterium]
MKNSPTISSLLTTATLAVNGRSQLSVGLQLSDGQRFWADCIVVSAASRRSAATAFDADQAIEHVQNVIRPLWQGQPLHQFRPLAQQLGKLMVPFSYKRTVWPTPKPQPAPGTVSRRSVITGFLAEEVKPEPELPQQEIVTIERPLHPALQYGLTAVLLKAVAQVNKLSIADLVAQEYELPLPETAVPLQIHLSDKNIQTARAILSTHIAALGYTIGNTDHTENLGANGERLQQHIRQLAAWLLKLDADFRPILNLDLRGRIGDLFENNSGKVLGALYGLEHAAKPFALHIQNPVWLDTQKAQLTHLEKLNSYLSIRRMTLKLVADGWVDSLQDAKLFANPKICQTIHIELPRLGNLDAGITAVLHILSQKQQIILSGDPHPLTSHIALATHPTLLSGSPHLHHNAMQKILKFT